MKTSNFKEWGKRISALGGILVFMICICSCSKNERVRDGIFRGIYEGANHAQEMKHMDEPPQLGKEAPTYDQYK
jgi:hypothetical protein